MELTVTYFEKPGQENTEACLRIVSEAVRTRGFKYIIVASTRGETGLRFSEQLKGAAAQVVVVTHSAGFKEPNTHEMEQDTRLQIEATGAKVYTGTMITHALETAFASRFNGLYPALIVAQALRRFGEGTKVCCEIAMMAVDAGLIPEHEEVLAVAGTAWGADTVLLMRSAASKRFLDLKVLEVLAKPRG
ncbi:MAG: pyruvate kinase alpha/beta domain-containing protein [Chloroflexota bacterium]